jgi:hypothetical protein
MSASERARLLDALALKSAPRLAKCVPQGIEERSQERAAQAFAAGVAASGESQRSLARRLRRDERTIRDWRDGTRVVPTWALIAMPRDGALAALRVLTEAVPEEEDEDQFQVA